MKQKILTLLSTVLIAFSIMAADKHNIDIFRSNPSNIQSILKESVSTDLEHRNDKSQVLDTKSMLTGDKELVWTDGRFLLSTIYYPEDKVIEAGYNHFMEPTPTIEKPHGMKIVGKKVTVKGNRNLTVTVEKMGQYTMLVYRNAQGNPVKAYYNIDIESVNNGSWTIFVHYLLAGNYMLANGENAVFGIRQDFYEGKKYNYDPGIYQFYIHPENNLIDIIYGEGRVSHGDPSSPKYGKMPGGGGAGAIMGPMIWQLCFTSQGLNVEVTRDERFVDHSPRLETKAVNVLTKVQCPWRGIDGKWAFASILPLTHELLKLFPKDVLELMRAEIYARHGDTFKSAENQKYFDAQPWYKKSGTRVILSDIERFNVALIKQVMAIY